MKKSTKTDKSILIGGQNIDEWIDEESKSSEEKIESTLKYEKKIVAFLDLLGITAEVQSKVNGQEDEIISKLEKIKDIVEKEAVRESIHKEITMLYISDSFIFVCDKATLSYFLKVLSTIQMRILLECQTMLRGAVEYGDVIIRDQGKQIIGPAYINAYLSQEKYAIFPRIIIGNSVIELIAESDKTLVSQDREYSLDYLDVYRECENKSIDQMITKLRREGLFDYLIQEYKKYNKLNKISIKSKYAWTINYLKEKGVWPDAKQYNCW